MPEQIINRVANSKLITIDLEDFYPQGKRVVFDIKDWLFEGLVLREKDFRKQVKEHAWSQYQDNYLALTCSTEAIIPSWAYMLIAIHVQPYVKMTVVGSISNLETSIFQNIISNLDISAYKNNLIIIKGCSNIIIPKSVYLMLTNKLIPVAKSIMYGEACSSVPLYKRK